MLAACYKALHKYSNITVWCGAFLNATVSGEVVGEHTGKMTFPK